MDQVFISLSRSDLKGLIAETIFDCLRHIPNTSIEKPQRSPGKKVYGLDGLAKLLNCSHPTAQRIKDSGKIPFSQAGRKLVFDADAVLDALKGKEVAK